MARKRHRPEQHLNHERWVLSYADFVTLLFAFFVVMFATAKADSSKARAVSESVKAAFSQGNVGDLRAALEVVEKENNPQKAVTSNIELGGSEKLLNKVLAAEIKKGEVDVHMEPRGLVISFKQGALFDSGEDVVKPSATVAMEKVAGVVQQLKNQIRLEGHTDNVPIHNAHFRNNWELSSARSIAILQMLNGRFNVLMNRLSVSGYADVAPIASNDTEIGRNKNRRADIVILTSQAARSEPTSKLASQ